MSAPGITRGCVGGPHAAGDVRDCVYCENERLRGHIAALTGYIRALARHQDWANYPEAMINAEDHIWQMRRER